VSELSPTVAADEELGVEMPVPVAASGLVQPYQLPASAFSLDYFVAAKVSVVSEADDLGSGCLGARRVDEIRRHETELT
jgi:hypothetical protein